MSIQQKDVVNNLVTFLVETFEGKATFPTMYLDTNAGFFSSLQDISAVQASTPLSSDGMTLAAQVEHTRFYLEVLLGRMQERTESIDWDKSWQIKTVSKDAWQGLQADLKKVYEDVLEQLRTINTWGDVELSEGLGVVVHSAYHLGAVRQMMKTLSERGDIATEL